MHPGTLRWCLWNTLPPSTPRHPLAARMHTPAAALTSLNRTAAQNKQEGVVLRISAEGGSLVQGTRQAHLW